MCWWFSKNAWLPSPFSSFKTVLCQYTPRIPNTEIAESKWNWEMIIDEESSSYGYWGCFRPKPRFEYLIKYAAPGQQ